MWAICAQAIAVQSSWLGARLMLVYLALDLEAGALKLGLIASTFAVTGLIAALPAGRLADRFGGARVAGAGIIASVGGLLAALVWPRFEGILLAALLLGLGHVATVVGQQGYVARMSDPQHADTSFGTLTAAAAAGQMIGPLVVTIASSRFAPNLRPDTNIGLLVCVGMLAIAVPTSFLLRRAERTVPVTTQHLRRSPAFGLLRTRGLWRSVVVSGAVITAVDLLTTFLPVWADARGIEPLVVGLLLTVRGASTLASRLGMSTLISKVGRMPLIVASVSIGALALSILPLVDVWGGFLLMIALGVGLGIPQPLTMAWVVSLTPAGARGAALGLRSTFNRLAQVTLPVIVGAVAAPIGVNAVFWSTGAILAVAAAITGREPKH